MSNKNRNADKKPLMYIVQPDYAETTRSSMQEIVIKRKADKPAPPKAEEKPVYHEKQQEEAVAQDVLQEDQKPAAEPVSQQTQEVREPENIKSQEEQKAEPQAVEETVEHEPPKAEKRKSLHLRPGSLRKNRKLSIMLPKRRKKHRRQEK